jgi:hypothetical protein
MPRPPSITLRRCDLPTWMCWPAGEAHVGNSRVALLIGGRPRTLRVPPGPQTVTVRIYSIFAGEHDVSVSLTAEEGTSYRFRCGFLRKARKRACLRLVLLATLYCGACWVGWAAMTVLREPALDILQQAFLASRNFDPALLPLAHRFVATVTSVPGAVGAGTVLFLVVARNLVCPLCRGPYYYLERES